MADIRNDQYLHRPGAGRGAITPADPLEVLLYDGSGNPLLVKTPTGETRAALGVAGYGHDGTSWRPVKVNASGQAEVTLTGRNVDLLTPINALAITDTARRIFNVDISRYRKIFVAGYSTHDQDITLEVRPITDRVMVAFDGTNFKPIDTVVFKTEWNNRLVHVNASLTWLNDLVADKIILAVKAFVAPTSGAITVYVAGVPS